MAKFGFGRRFYDLKCFEVGNFFIFLGFIINLRAPLRKNVDKKFNIILSYLKYILDKYVINTPT